MGHESVRYTRPSRTAFNTFLLAPINDSNLVEAVGPHKTRGRVSPGISNADGHPWKSLVSEGGEIISCGG